MVSLCLKKHQNEEILSWLNETLRDFLIGKDTNAEAIEIETLEPQTIGLVNIFRTSSVGEVSASNDQVIERNFADKIRKEVNNAVMVDKNRVHDAILTALDNVVMPRDEMAVRSITESSERGPNSNVQNPDPWDFSGITENTPVMSALSRVDLNIDHILLPHG